MMALEEHKSHLESPLPGRTILVHPEKMVCEKVGRGLEWFRPVRRHGYLTV